MNGLQMDQVKRVYEYIDHLKSAHKDEGDKKFDDFSDIFELRAKNKDIDELIYVKLRLDGIKNESLLLSKEKKELTNRLFELEKRIFGGNFDEI